jgi:hypothetical protein
MGSTCSMHGDRRNVCKILIGLPQGNKPCGTPRGEREDSIKTDLKRNMAQRWSFCDMVMNFRLHKRKVLFHRLLNCRLFNEQPPPCAWLNVGHV